MITSHALKQIGFSDKEASTILTKLDFLSVKRHKTKVRHSYLRNGNQCDMEMIVRGYSKSDTIKALMSTGSDLWKDIAIKLAGVFE